MYLAVAQDQIMVLQYVGASLKRTRTYALQDIQLATLCANKYA